MLVRGTIVRSTKHYVCNQAEKIRKLTTIHVYLYQFTSMYYASKVRMDLLLNKVKIINRNLCYFYMTCLFLETSFLQMRISE